MAWTARAEISQGELVSGLPPMKYSLMRTRDCLTHQRYTLVQRNLFREIGVWEKQSSAFFQVQNQI